MNDLIIPIAALAGVWLIFIILRAPSIVLFLSLLVGQVLSAQQAEQVSMWMEPIVRVENIEYMQLAILILPVALTLLIMKDRITKPKLTIEAIPYAFIAALAVLFASDYIFTLQQQIQLSEDQFGSYKPLVVAIASISSLITAWITYPKQHHSKLGVGGKKKHHK